MFRRLQGLGAPGLLGMALGHFIFSLTGLKGSYLLIFSKALKAPLSNLGRVLINNIEKRILALQLH